VSEAGTNLLRVRGEGGQRVTSFELFFDLVYVFAATQLSRHLLEHLSVRGAIQTLVLLLAIWLAWMYTSWTTNWFDPDHSLMRLLLIGVMAASLVMSAALPQAYAGRSLWFASAYVALQVGRTAVVAISVRGQVLARNFQRVLFWQAVPGVLWIAGAFTEPTAQLVIWLLAVALEYAAPWIGFATPGLGRSSTADWTIDGGHMAERCQLFVIIALGESILVSGMTFGDLTSAPATLTALMLAFLGSVALWWIYFDRSAEAAAKRVADSADPGRLGRSAYTYGHIPMVAGIIVTAVADELVIAHPGGHLSAATTAVTLGGPALFLAGHALFKHTVFDHPSWPRMIAIAALVVLAPAAAFVPPLALSAAVTVILALVAASDLWAYLLRRR
jgi:low temperature requirement protein LtrA